MWAWSALPEGALCLEAVNDQNTALLVCVDVVKLVWAWLPEGALDVAVDEGAAVGEAEALLYPVPLHHHLRERGRERERERWAREREGREREGG